MTEKIWAGIFVIFLGSLVVISAIFNWGKMFTGKARLFSLPWFSNRFGRKKARLLASVLGTLVIFYGAYFIKMSL